MKTEESTQGFSLGAQIGGADAASVTREFIGKLRQTLLRHCRGPYSQVINEIALILRVDGNIQYWNKFGVGQVIVRKRYKYVEAEIFVPRELWETNNQNKISLYLADNLRVATDLIIDALKKAKISAEFEKMRIDIDVCIREYLN